MKYIKKFESFTIFDFDKLFDFINTFFIDLGYKCESKKEVSKDKDLYYRNYNYSSFFYKKNKKIFKLSINVEFWFNRFDIQIIEFLNNYDYSNYLKTINGLELKSSFNLINQKNTEFKIKYNINYIINQFSKENFLLNISANKYNI